MGENLMFKILLLGRLKMQENHLFKRLKDKDLGCPGDCPYLDKCDGDDCELLEDWEDEQWRRADEEMEIEKIYGG
jgi:hypothetical protein